MIASSLNVTILLALLVCLCKTNAARILVILPTAGKSHFVVGKALSAGLAEAGHQVTFASAYAFETTVDTLEVVHLNGVIDWVEGSLKMVWKIAKYLYTYCF